MSNKRQPILQDFCKSLRHFQLYEQLFYERNITLSRKVQRAELELMKFVSILFDIQKHYYTCFTLAEEY